MDLILQVSFQKFSRPTDFKVIPIFEYSLKFSTGFLVVFSHVIRLGFFWRHILFLINLIIRENPYLYINPTKVVECFFLASTLDFFSVDAGNFSARFVHLLHFRILALNLFRSDEKRYIAKPKCILCGGPLFH
jgi:hypothetical protein